MSAAVPVASLLLFISALTPQPSTAIPPKYVSCLFCFHEKTDISCWLPPVQEGLTLHPESVRPLLSFFPFESCISSCQPEIVPERPVACRCLHERSVAWKPCSSVSRSVSCCALCLVQGLPAAPLPSEPLGGCYNQLIPADQA